MPKKPPLNVILVAVAALVLGGLGMADGIFKTFLFFTGKQVFGATIDTSGGLAAYAVGYAYFDMFQLFLGWVITMGYLAIGEGLLKMRPWAREAAVYGAYVSLGHKALWALYTIAILLPAAAALRSARPNTVDLTFSLITTPFLTALFPIALLWVVTQPDVVEFWARIPPDEPKGKKAPAAAPAVSPAPVSDAMRADRLPSEPSEGIRAVSPPPPENDGPTPPTDTHIQPV